MKVGNLVVMKTNLTNKGVVLSVLGKKWVKVAWDDHVVLEEHIADLKVVSEGAK
tara:strand:+ start:4902 stop:5063 length:162 start_codon:yes stop_codon:yes gene_type:complete